MKIATKTPRHEEFIGLTDGQKIELEKRLTSYFENPNAGTPWTDVRKKILASE